MKFSKLVVGLGMAGLSLFGFGVSQADAAEVSHTVKSGETLSSIAQTYFNDASQYTTIANANNISNAHFIVAGQVLTFDTDAEYVAPTQQAAPVQQTAAVETQAAPAQTTTYTSNASGSEAEAKSWIAFKESTNNYNATNGRYIGKYQLTDSYLNGDYSPANQERVADNYVASRYGSWTNAKAFWLANGWY